MDVNLGLRLFKTITQHKAPDEDNVEAWLPYYEKYHHVFDVLFEKLYMSSLSDLHPYINTLSFEDMLRRAKSSLKKHPVTRIQEIVDECIRYFGYDESFDVFMLVGLDGIDGAAPISDEPFLFFGLERMNDSDLNILIPHEFSHLCRFQYLKGLENVNQLTVRQLIIAEGLATLTPLVMHQQPLSSENLAKALMVTAKEYEDLQAGKKVIRTQITKDFDRKLSPELVATYFMANEASGLPKKSGYFFGTMIISSLLQSGFSLKELTYKKTEEVCRLYER